MHKLYNLIGSLNYFINFFFQEQIIMFLIKFARNIIMRYFTLCVYKVKCIQEISANHISAKLNELNINMYAYITYTRYMIIRSWTQHVK